MPSDVKQSISEYVGAASTGSYVFHALNRVSKGGHLDWQDRQRFDDLKDLLESARRGAEPYSARRQQRKKALLAARANPTAADLPSSHEDQSSRDLLLTLVEEGLTIQQFVDEVLPAVSIIARDGALEHLDRDQRIVVERKLHPFSYRLAHVTDQALEERRARGYELGARLTCR
jgi:hypothetical protein